MLFQFHRLDDMRKLNETKCEREIERRLRVFERMLIALDLVWMKSFDFQLLFYSRDHLQYRTEWIKMLKSMNT